MRKLSIIHPSRSRSEQAFATYNKWVENADNHFEYIASWDTDDCDPYYRKFFYVDHLITICLRDNKSAIEAINEAAEIATGDIFVVISDDFDCHPHWDTLLLKELEGKEDFCAKTEDGAQKFIITLPIMDRKYYERFGYIYNPLYEHMFCDTEISCVAWMLNNYLEIDLTFKHNHYSYGGMVKDVINEKNDATWDQGKEVFKKRYNNNFGIVPVKELPEHSGIVKYMKTI